MSFDLGAAARAELAKPETLAELRKLGLEAIEAITFIEGLILRVGETAIESVVPGVFRPLWNAVVKPLEDRGITALENLTEEEAKKLLPVTATATIGTQTFALTVAKVWPADLPQSPFESLPDGGGVDRNEE